MKNFENNSEVFGQKAVSLIFKRGKNSKNSIWGHRPAESGTIQNISVRTSDVQRLKANGLAMAAAVQKQQKHNLLTFNLLTLDVNRLRTSDVLKLKTKKPFTRSKRLFGVDPTGFTPVLPFVKDGVLLHKLQAQGPQQEIKTKEVLLQGPPLLTNGDL